MLILAIETATQQGSLALGDVSADSCEILISKTWIRKNSHGELVTPNIEEVLETAGFSLNQIDAFAVDVGPGSFTGIRVGLNIVKSFAYALGSKPVYTFNSLEILAHSVPLFCLSKTPIFAMINAHKSQCYVASFTPTKKSLKIKIKPQAMTLDKLEKTIKTKHVCIGEGYFSFEADLNKALKTKLMRFSDLSNYPLASTMIQLLNKNYKKSRPKTWTELEALYIRGSEAEEKLKAGTLKPLPEY